MTKMLHLIAKLRIWKDTRGQDMVEYALLVGFVSLAAGVFIPDVASAMSTIYFKVGSKLIEGGG